MRGVEPEIHIALIHAHGGIREDGFALTLYTAGVIGMDMGQ